MPAPRVTVIVPAYCEERLIGTTLRSIPADVSEIIVVDDASPDRTRGEADAVGDPRVTIISHEENRGVGAAIYTGYQAALRGNGDVFVVMAADNQMDREDLPALVEPIFLGVADYVKGNRFAHPDVDRMPWIRRQGSRWLGALTSFASGVKLSDTQCGYTAITRAAVRRLPFLEMWRRYGYPNDLLILLIRRGLRVMETPVRPVYAGEASGLRPWHFFAILFVILRRFVLEMLWLRARPVSRGAVRALPVAPLHLDTSPLEKEFRFAKK